MNYHAISMFTNSDLIELAEVPEDEPLRLIMQEVVLNPGSPHTIQFLKAVYGLIRG